MEMESIEESLEKDHIEAILKNLIKRINEGRDF